MGTKKRPPTFVQIVQAAIDRQGLSNSALGKAAGVDRALIGRFLKGERTINVGTFEKLCGVLGLVLVERA